MGDKSKAMAVSAIQLLGLSGVLVAYYAYHVESKLNDPFYEPVCNTSWGSCATVFRSSYSKLFSHWGVVPKGHMLDLSLAESGMIIYLVYALWPYWRKVVPSAEKLLLLMSLAGCTMSVYLHYVPHHQLYDALLRVQRTIEVFNQQGEDKVKSDPHNLCIHGGVHLSHKHQWSDNLETASSIIGHETDLVLVHKWVNHMTTNQSLTSAFLINY